MAGYIVGSIFGLVAQFCIVVGLDWSPSILVMLGICLGAGFVGGALGSVSLAALIYLRRNP